MYHYPVVGDKDRLPEEKGVKPEAYPSPLLGNRNWKLVESVSSVDGSEARAVFETDVAEPYFIRIRKTYTLAPKDYHLGLKLEFTALPGRPGTDNRDRAKFRYQIAGAAVCRWKVNGTPRRSEMRSSAGRPPAAPPSEPSKTRAQFTPPTVAP